MSRATHIPTQHDSTIQVLSDMTQHIPTFDMPTPTTHCSTSEDNAGALEVANAVQMRLRTKHINGIYGTTCGQRSNSALTQNKHWINFADDFTKPLAGPLFQSFEVPHYGMAILV
mmetsp:Transcript_2066/g.5129  ORF Transcript_2066/g.5129 Transcript_2066/m.5129 type:complete len:115 (-) Transcript_2066:187-531(-)